MVKDASAVSLHMSEPNRTEVCGLWDTELIYPHSEKLEPKTAVGESQLNFHSERTMAWFCYSVPVRRASVTVSQHKQISGP